MEAVLNTRPVTWKDSYKMWILRLIVQMVHMITYQLKISTSNLHSAQHRQITSTYWGAKCTATLENLS